MRLSNLGLGVAFLAWVGCGGGQGPDGGTADAGGVPDAGSSDAGPGDAGTGPGRSFATAIPLTVDATATAGVLPNTATKDYYQLTLTQGDRLLFGTQTAAATNNNGSVTDTVLTLWNSAKTQVAQDDDGWPRSSTDSTLFFQVPSTGTYYVTVEDCNSAFGGSGCSTASGVTDFNYKLYVYHVSSTAFPELNAAATQDGGTAQAQSLTYKAVPNAPAGQFYFDVIDGTFRDTADTHVFSLTPPANTYVLPGQRARADFFFQPIGPTNGDGSTANAKIWLTDSTGTKVVAGANQSNYRDRDNATNGPLDLSVPVALGQQYFLFVQSAATSSMPFTDYSFTQHFVGSYFYGQAEKEGLSGGTNDTLATAEVLTSPTTATAGSFFVDGDISPVGDIDWFEADPPAGTTSVFLSCGAARTGSGVVGLTATLYDPTGTQAIGVIGPETATADLYTDGISVDAGTAKAFLKVSASSQDATNTGTAYTCTVAYSNM